MDDFTSRLKPAEPSGPAALDKERAGSNVPVKELTQHLLSRDGFLERQERVLKPMLQEKLLSKATQMHLSRADRYKLGLARAKLLRRMADKHNWNLADYHMADYLVDEMSPYHLHMSMFRTTIAEQASDEQQAYWMPLINQWKIIGSYAQTEMGHGSNVRGLELRAFYDPSKREFILHSPTLTSSKWWNGSLGRTATHAIVVAQLMLPANAAQKKTDSPPPLPHNDSPTASSAATPTGAPKDAQYVSYGPHPFIVEMRNLKTHKPHPGIVIGDIGPKYGYTSMDNAYALFDSHRVPHSAFLSRYSKVDPDTGAYTKPENPAVVYGSLTDIRTRIIMQARLVLARAVTIAIRYLAIRRQFADRDAPTASAPAITSATPSTVTHEVAVLDYPTVQIRVLPLLATVYALHYSGAAMGALYRRTRADISTGDFKHLSDLHATSSGLKSLCTTYAADGIETCRRACGGHGFIGTSGFVGLNADYLSKPTVEGDNWLITQQAASYLIKKAGTVAARLAASGPEAIPTEPPADATEASIQRYLLLRRTRAGTGKDARAGLPVLKSSRALVEAFERRAACAAYEAWEARVQRKIPWSRMLVQLHALSNAHSQAMVVRNFYDALQAGSAGADDGVPGIPDRARPVMHALFRLYALRTLQVEAVSFLATKPGCVTLKQLEGVDAVLHALMREIRPHAVALVDAWAIPDYLLDSALGASDGRVYERLFDAAHRRNPLNKETVNPWYWDEEIVQGESRTVTEGRGGSKL